MEMENNPKQLIEQIRSLYFAVNDISLYLDTHPCDMRALEAHKEFSSKLEELKKIYETKFNSLSIYSPTNNWEQWINTKWPWERGGM